MDSCRPQYFMSSSYKAQNISPPSLFSWSNWHVTLLTCFCPVRLTRNASRHASKHVSVVDDVDDDDEDDGVVVGGVQYCGSAASPCPGSLNGHAQLSRCSKSIFRKRSWSLSPVCFLLKVVSSFFLFFLSFFLNALVKMIGNISPSVSCGDVLNHEPSKSISPRLCSSSPSVRKTTGKQNNNTAR